MLQAKGMDCTKAGFRWSYEVLQDLKYLEAFIMEVMSRFEGTLLTVATSIRIQCFISKKLCGCAFQVLRLHPSIPREGK